MDGTLYTNYFSTGSTLSVSMNPDNVIIVPKIVIAVNNELFAMVELPPRIGLSVILQSNGFGRERKEILLENLPDSVYELCFSILCVLFSFECLYCIETLLSEYLTSGKVLAWKVSLRKTKFLDS